MKQDTISSSEERRGAGRTEEKLKSVVLEIRGRRAAVLSHDGVVRILPDQGYRTGQVLEFTRKDLDELERRAERLKDENSSPKVVSFGSFIRKHAAAAAAVVLITALGTGTGVAAAYYPVSTVKLSADSVQTTYRLNIFDRVISVQTEDPENAGIASDVEKSVKGKPIGSAMTVTLDLLDERGAFTEDKRTIEVGVDNRFHEESRLETVLTDTVELWNNEKKETPGSVSLVWNDDINGRSRNNPGEEPDDPENGSDGEIETGGDDIPGTGGSFAPKDIEPAGNTGAASPEFFTPGDQGPGEGTGAAPGDFTPGDQSPEGNAGAGPGGDFTPGDQGPEGNAGAGPGGDSTPGDQGPADSAGKAITPGDLGPEGNVGAGPGGGSTPGDPGLGGSGEADLSGTLTPGDQGLANSPGTDPAGSTEGDPTGSFMPGDQGAEGGAGAGPGVDFAPGDPGLGAAFSPDGHAAP